MKPIGTITKYYPFVDPETRNTLEGMVEKATNYQDFVCLLGEKAYRDDVPLYLAYLAAVYAWQIAEDNTLQNLATKYNNVPIIQVWRFPFHSVQEDRLRHYADFREAFDKAVATIDDDWILVELQLLHVDFRSEIRSVPEFLEPLSEAKSLIENNPRLRCFNPLVHAMEGLAKFKEGDLIGCTADCLRGLKVSEANNDPFYAYRNLKLMAVAKGRTDTQEALRLYDEAYTIACTLGATHFESVILNNSAIIYEITGEYDLALHCHFKNLEVYFKPEEPREIPGSILSRIYSSLDDGESALHWADVVLDSMGDVRSSKSQMRRARALILLGQLEEVEHHLAIANELALKSGNDIEIGEYIFVSGLYEMARGDCLTAMRTLEEAIDVFESGPAHLHLNNILLALVKAEISMTGTRFGEEAADSSGPWMTRLEKHARAYGLTGIAMQAALLKAEFLVNQNRRDDARGVLTEALEASDSPGVRTLRERILDQIEVLDKQSEA